MGFGAFIGPLLSIIDKFVPKRKERLQDALHRLERELANALASNNDGRVMLIRSRMSVLRTRIKHLDK